MTSSTNMLVQLGKKAEGKGWEARVSQQQREAIMAGAFKPTTEEVDQLGAYVASGDLAHLPTTTKAKIDATIRVAKERLNASQGKRIWPRKVAAVILDQQTR
jgi:hypothetical protein